MKRPSLVVSPNQKIGKQFTKKQKTENVGELSDRKRPEVFKWSFLLNPKIWIILWKPVKRSEYEILFVRKNSKLFFNLLKKPEEKLDIPFDVGTEMSKRFFRRPETLRWTEGITDNGGYSFAAMWL